VRKIKLIKSEKKFCLICMEEHEVQTVIVTDVEEYNGEEVSFEAIYEYCSLSDEYLETEPGKRKTLTKKWTTLLHQSPIIESAKETMYGGCRSDQSGPI
jgi:hypothetical protein